MFLIAAGMLLVWGGAPSPALAGDICDYYRRVSPSLYRIFCSGAHRKASTAGARSTFADAFNVNPGALPTEPSSYGLESIGSYIRRNIGLWSPTFALVKGYHKFGTGVSTSGNSTFYGNDLIRRVLGPSSLDTFQPPEKAVGHLTNVNLGAAVSLWSSRRDFAIKLGATGRYNKTTDTFGGGGGLYLNTGPLSFGAGLTREKVSNYIPATYFGSFLLGYQLWHFDLEYLLLTNSAGMGLRPIHVLTATVGFGRVLVTVANRWLNYLPEGTVSQQHLAVQVMVSGSFAIGALYNYIPGANSLALQYYL